MSPRRNPIIQTPQYTWIGYEEKFIGYSDYIRETTYENILKGYSEEEQVDGTKIRNFKLENGYYQFDANFIYNEIYIDGKKVPFETTYMGGAAHTGYKVLCKEGTIIDARFKNPSSGELTTSSIDISGYRCVVAVEEQVDNSQDSEVKYYDLNVGRIYGVTITDVSSYIDRTIFYDYLKDNQFYQGVKNKGIITVDGDYQNIYFNSLTKMIDKVKDSNYKFLCILDSYDSYIGDDNLCLDYGNREYIMKSGEIYNQQSVFHMGHGGYTHWSYLGVMEGVPELKMPFLFANGCNTNDFEEPNQLYIATYLLRKGAMAHVGTISAVLLGTGGAENWFDLLLSGEKRSLGEIHSKVIDEGDIRYMTKFSLIGDPTLELDFEEVKYED